MNTSKIIKGVVGGGRYTVTSPIVKEDYGLYLKIEGLELPSTYEVDFSNSEHNGTSVTMIGNSDGVLIPSQFISSGKDVFAFLYHVGEDYGRTIFKFRIPNKCRPDRTDETPTPEEQSTIDQAISALNSAVEQTAQDVIDADASAQSASADADRASANANFAHGYAEQAEQSAQNAHASALQASASATASAQSASQASASEQGCARAVLDAASAAAIARARADEASGYAQTASAKAQDASGYAQTASEKASEASQSAATASNKASEASQSATTASNKASEASQSATTASNKASEASGYATASQTAQGLAESARDLAQGYAEDAQGYAEDAQASAEGISASASQIAQNTANILKAFPTDTASGAVASFTDGADDLPLKSLVVDINPVQDLSQGDPSPENICPISGWTQVGVEQRGKNLLPNAMVQDTSTRVRLGESSVGNGNPFKAGTYRISYAFKDDTTPKTPYWRTYKNGVNGTVNNGWIITLTEDTNIKVWLYNPNGSSVDNVDWAMVELGSTTTSYEPYTGRSITIDLGQTVYGGHLDVLTGILTVYPYYASYNGETLTGRWISDRDAYVAGTTPTIGAQVVNIGAQGTEYQLEPHEIASLLGQNNIFADTGDVSCEYRADTRLYIEKLTQPTEDDMAANSAITSGQFFMVGNSLYRALANIASGATITVGTNAQRVSLADALNLINT